jgi:hypothetical protein
VESAIPPQSIPSMPPQSATHKSFGLPGAYLWSHGHTPGALGPAQGVPTTSPEALGLAHGASTTSPEALGLAHGASTTSPEALGLAHGASTTSPEAFGLACGHGLSTTSSGAMGPSHGSHGFRSSRTPPGTLGPAHGLSPTVNLDKHSYFVPPHGYSTSSTGALGPVHAFENVTSNIEPQVPGLVGDNFSNLSPPPIPSYGVLHLPQASHTSPKASPPPPIPAMFLMASPTPP